MPYATVDDWAATFTVPPDLARRLEPEPAWVVPAGAVVGLAPVLALGADAATAPVALVGVVTFLVGLVVRHLAVGPAPLAWLAHGASMAAWTWIAWFVTAGLDAGWVPVVAFVAVGVVGEAAVGARERKVVRARQAAVRALADGGTRTPGRFVAGGDVPGDGPTVVAADGSDRRWSVVPRAWDRPGVARTWATATPVWALPRLATGHPVGVWTTATGEAAVVLVPRRRPPEQRRPA